MSYSHVSDHRAMIFDGPRNAHYYQALQAVVNHRSVVMDLGAGLGIHGLNAAALGAARVHFVEPSPVLDIVREVAEAATNCDFHYHNCRVQDLALDQRVDILVSVFTGNFLLTEDLLGSLFHARDRFLKPGGHMIPDRATMRVMPVTAAAFYERHVACWEGYAAHAQAHGEPALDYHPARAYAANTLYYDTWESIAATPLADPATLLEMDLASAQSASCDSRIALSASRSGTCHGWLGWSDIRLGERWLATAGEDQRTHWLPVFLPLETPVRVSAGDTLALGLKRPEYGEWSWVTEHREVVQRQSTFLSVPLSPGRLQRRSDAWQPALGGRGEAARWLLSHMDGKSSLAALSEGLLATFPGTFVNAADARRFAHEVVKQFASD